MVFFWRFFVSILILPNQNSVRSDHFNAYFIGYHVVFFVYFYNLLIRRLYFFFILQITLMSVADSCFSLYVALSMVVSFLYILSDL